VVGLTVDGTGVGGCVGLFVVGSAEIGGAVRVCFSTVVGLNVSKDSAGGSALQTPLPQTVPPRTTAANRRRTARQKNLDPVVDGIHLSKSDRSSALRTSAFGIVSIFRVMLLLLCLLQFHEWKKLAAVFQ
jgi:hypothetical protein